MTRAIATATGLLAGLAHADEPPPVRLELEVEAACTDASDFGRRMQARSSRLELGPGEEAIPVQITILPARAGSELEGSVRVGASVRRVDGATCEEVADALSLVTVLMFDLEASAEPAEAPPEAPPEQAPPAAPPSPAFVRLPVRPAPAPKEDWRWALGAHGVGAAVPELPIGASAFCEMSRGRQLSSLALRLALTTYSANVELGQRTANLLWLFLSPQVCPLRFETGPLSAFPCAGLAMGVLSSEPTRGVTRPRSFTRGWVAPRAIMRGRLALTPRLAVELEAALDAPIIRDRYAFGGLEAYRVPPVVPSLGAGLALELP